MALQFKEISFPVSGVDRRRGYQEQPPFTSPWAVNVRPIGPIDGRARGGRRPGLKKAIASSLGSGVTALAPVTVVVDGVRTERLAVVAGMSMAVLSNGSLTTPAGDLATEAGLAITTEAGADLTASAALSSVCQFDDRSMQLYAADGTVKVCDPTTGVIAPLVASTGEVPTGCTLVRTYRDRLVLAGADHVVWMSRMGDPTDWSMGDVEDTGKAVALQLSDAGHIGNAVTAMFTRGDDSLVIGCDDSLWVLQGDPGDGQLNNQCRNVGIVAPNAWCKTDSLVLFLGRDGLYVWPNGDVPQRFSQEKLPEALVNVDASDNTVTMAYDPVGYGVWLFVTPSTGVGTHWWIDLRNKGIWPVLLPEGLQPLTACQYQGELWVGCRDGYVRKFDAESDDDGTAIASHVLIGPLWLSGSGATDGLLAELQGVVSGEATWSIVAGESAAMAVDKACEAIEDYTPGATPPTSASGSWSDGRNRISHPRVRSPWVVLWLSSTAAWECEGATLGVQRLGRWR